MSLNPASSLSLTSQRGLAVDATRLAGPWDQPVKSDNSVKAAWTTVYQNTGEYWPLLLAFFGVGAAFAVMVFTLSVVSAPLLLDRPVDLLLDKLFRPKIGKRFGGRMKALVSEAGPAADKVENGQTGNATSVSAATRRNAGRKGMRATSFHGGVADNVSNCFHRCSPCSRVRRVRLWPKAGV